MASSKKRPRNVQWDEKVALDFCHKYFRGQKYYFDEGLLCIGDEGYDLDTVTYCMENNVDRDTLYVWSSYCYDVDMINIYVKENMQLPKPTLKDWHIGDCGKVSRSTLRDMLNATHRYTTNYMELMRVHEKAMKELENKNNTYFV